MYILQRLENIQIPQYKRSRHLINYSIMAAKATTVTEAAVIIGERQVSFVHRPARTGCLDHWAELCGERGGCDGLSQLENRSAIDGVTE